jgi:hypothetical protein
MKEGAPFKEAYCLRVVDSSTGMTEQLDDVMPNRVKLRKYLQELSYY